MSSVIKVENLSKKYIIGLQKQDKNDTLRDVIANGAKSFGSKLLSPFARNASPIIDPAHEEFWALKDVSFEIQQGDRVGIIGRNGAGKSTLLKVLSRIVEPTSGKVSIKGRVASLLEVGTGFHPELTGRENIFLNGAILGMSKVDIQRNFDAIVDFSEVEKFLDTPVKRYSSGMYVRLAFAVAAHLEPEILIVDEVLAVGDAQFQKKCLGKMQNVSSKGRTVLFVSHNMAAISALCGSALLMNSGRLAKYGETEGIIKVYMHEVAAKLVSIKERRDRTGRGRLKFMETWTETAENKRIDNFLSGDDVVIVVKYEASAVIRGALAVGIAIKRELGEWITDLSSECSGFNWDTIPQDGEVRCRLPNIPLNAGLYYFSLIARINGEIEDFILDVGYFTVEQGDFFGTGKLHSSSHGVFLFKQEWSLSE